MLEGRRREKLRRKMQTGILINLFLEFLFFLKEKWFEERVSFLFLLKETMKRGQTFRLEEEEVVVLQAN